MVGGAATLGSMENAFLVFGKAVDDEAVDTAPVDTSKVPRAREMLEMLVHDASVESGPAWSIGQVRRGPRRISSS